MFKIIPATYSLDMTMALGLMPDSYSLKIQVNYCFLQARYFIWTSKFKERKLTFDGYRQLLTSRYEIESKGNVSELTKWESLVPSSLNLHSN